MTVKYVSYPGYKCIYNRSTGFQIRCGDTLDKDPRYSEYGPEFVTIEICKGGDCIGCDFCYKGNGRGQETKLLSLSDFKKIVDKLPDTVNQVALGIMNIETNPEIWKMAEYLREKEISPLVTINGLANDRQIDLLGDLFDAVSVSIYKKYKDRAMETLQKLSRKDMQVNAHMVFHKENVSDVSLAIQEVDEVVGVNSFVVVRYKDKNNNRFKAPGVQEYNLLFKDLIGKVSMPISFDTCSVDLLRSTPSLVDMRFKCEECEAGKFSCYINLKGKMFPCSFLEEESEKTSLVDGDFMEEWGNNIFLGNCKYDGKNNKEEA